jgi:hypothetical protein
MQTDGAMQNHSSNRRAEIDLVCFLWGKATVSTVQKKNLTRKLLHRRHQEIARYLLPLELARGNYVSLPKVRNF